MPTRDAQRYAIVEFLLRGIHPSGVHRSHQLVSTVRGFLVEKRRGLEWIEVRPRIAPIFIFRKVILGLGKVGKKDLIPVGQGLVVVLIGSHRRFCRRYHCIRLLLIAGLEWREGRQIHMPRHVGVSHIGGLGGIPSPYGGYCREGTNGPAKERG